MTERIESCNIYTVAPVLSDTPSDQGNVSDCTGCQNTQVLFQLIEILWDHKFLSDVTGCRIAQVPLYIYIYIDIYDISIYMPQCNNICFRRIKRKRKKFHVSQYD
jgi:hypothetical protein